MGAVMIVLIEILVEILQGIGSLFTRSRSDINLAFDPVDVGAGNAMVGARRKRSEMERLRDLLRTLDDQPVRPTGGPNSLYEAGRVGASSGARPARRAASRDASIDSATEPTAEERTTRRQQPVAQTSQPATPAARRIRAALQNPESLRTAILLREVLDPPVSRRPRPSGRR